jgi:RNA polymerase sigma factor (sigma-70 family)
LLTKEEDIVESLFRSEYPKLLSYAQKRLGRAEPAQDLVQDTFHEALKLRKKLNSHPNPQGWLMQTLKYKVLTYENELARSAKLFAGSEALGELAAESDITDLMLTVEQTLTVQEFRLFRRIVLQGDSYLEVAQDMGITLWTCRQRLCRIRKKLQTALTQQGKGENGKLLCQLLLLSALLR